MVVVAIALALRLAISRLAAGALTAPAAIAGVAILAALSAWMLWSGSWSGARGRALFEADRALLYLLVFAFCASLPRSSEGMRWTVRSIALGIVVVCLCALITRVLPDLWPTASTIANDRLSYPVTYWNALGLMAATGLLLTFGMTADPGEPPLSRVLAAGAMPILSATLLFTFSRSSLALSVVALLVLCAVNRSRMLVSALLVFPAALVALAAAWSADALTSTTPTSDVAISQGKTVAFVVALCVFGAIAGRATMLRYDDAVGDARLQPRIRRRVVMALAAGALAVVAVGLAAGGASALSDQYDKFVKGDTIQERGDFRNRLVDPGNNGRRDQWSVAAAGWADARLKGNGSGTYSVLWFRQRETEYRVIDGHSLYLEALAEIGIVGLLLILGAAALMLGVFIRRAQGRDRPLYAAVLAGGLLWAVHAGIDWDWEMPAATMWVFAAAGSAAAASLPRAAEIAPRLRLGLRIAVPVVALVLAITPLRIARSEAASRSAKQAFAQRDCATATAKARDTVDALDVTPEPHEILGYCLIRAGDGSGAVSEFHTALKKDPDNWRVWYGLAVAQAVAGQDPRPSVKRARALNPLDGDLFTLSDQFSKTTAPGSWRKRALSAPLPTD